MNSLAKVISFVLHPLLMATYLYLLFAAIQPSALSPIRKEVFGPVLVLIFMVTFAFPAASILALRIFGFISSVAIPQRSERQIPFFIIAVIYIAMTYFFYRNFGFVVTDSFFKFLLILDMLVVAATLITFFYKISVHSMAIWGALGVLIPLNQDSADGILFYPILGIIVLSGAVMSSRLYLQAHSFREVITGALAGFAISFAGMISLF